MDFDKIFKAYDIRGIYPDELNDDFAYKLGLAYGKMLKNENASKSVLNIVVGYDMRLSSPALFDSLVKGLLDIGVNVINIGLTSTPTFYFAVAKYEYDGGIQISASHNPKEYNGFKMTRKRAIPISGETGILTLKELVKENKFDLAKEKGKLSEKENIIDEHVDYALNYFNYEITKPFKIVIDTANAMGGPLLDKMFQKTNCQVKKIFFELDGNFPNHEADPMKDENNQSLCQTVIEEKADLGIATDGDSDRVFFIDNKGKMISPALIRGLLSKILLQKYPNSKVCYDIRPGKITYDLIKENGGTPIRTRVGHSLIKEHALRENAIFAGESSGHFFLNMPCGFYEAPLIVILLLLEEFSKTDLSVSEYLQPFNKYYHSKEINFNVSDKDLALRLLAEKYNDGEIDNLDGLSVTYNDWWFNVRSSNTESKLRLNLEAINEELMQIKTKEISDIIKTI